jgi:hypothetical protein
VTRQARGTSSPLQLCSLCTSSTTSGDPMQLHAGSTFRSSSLDADASRAPGRARCRHLPPRHGIREPRGHLVGRAASTKYDPRRHQDPLPSSELAPTRSGRAPWPGRASASVAPYRRYARTSPHRKACRRQPTTATSRRDLGLKSVTCWAPVPREVGGLTSCRRREHHDVGMLCHRHRSEEAL